MSLSLYLHLPFCRSKCRYCDFYSETISGALIGRYIEALSREWEMRTAGGGSSPSLTSIYIGGGTPTVLSVAEWQSLGARLLSHLPISAEAELTVECNPDSFTEEKAGQLAELGVTRLTVGVQSLNDHELRVLNRPHTVAMVKKVLDSPVLRMFRSVGVDVMYGLPGQTLSSFDATLQWLLSRDIVKHLSAYELTIADATPFGRHRRILPLPDDDSIMAMTELLMNTTRLHGFNQYEISNFAREGHCCKHNIHYWEHEPYIGLGASAHSFCKDLRSWNVADIARYCSMVENGVLPVAASEPVDRDTCARELLFLGFRRIAGLNETIFRAKTGIDFLDWVDRSVVYRFITEEYLVYDPPWWRPTEKGLLHADYLARELF